MQPERRPRAEPENARRFERLISTLPCALYDYARWPDGHCRFLYISPQCEAIFEHPAEAVMADGNLLWSMVHPDDLERLQLEDGRTNRSGDQFQAEVRIRLPSGGLRWIQLTSRPGSHQVDGQTVWSGVILDISDRKRVEAERDRLVAELRTALAEVKTLSGFLPICMSCKKIRDDHGYWNQLEAYISEHSGAQFSHGVCPDCAARYRAEFERANIRPQATALEV